MWNINFESSCRGGNYIIYKDKITLEKYFTEKNSEFLYFRLEHKIITSMEKKPVEADFVHYVIL